MGKYYAVAAGRSPGIYTTWAACSTQVSGFSGSVYKSFNTETEASRFISQKTSSSTSRTITGVSKKINRSSLQKSSVSTVVENDDSCITIYTDGACKSNGHANALAGCGVFYGINDSRNKSVKLPPHSDFKPTNNRAEMMAVIMALESHPKAEKIKIMTDSQYTMKGVKSWLKTWKSKNWIKSDGLPVLNIDLWKRLDELYTGNESHISIVLNFY